MSNSRFALWSLVFVLAISARAVAVTVSDGDFSSWTNTDLQGNPPAAVASSGTRLAAGGNPGAMYVAGIAGGGPGDTELDVANIKGDYTNTNALSGAWTMKVDFKKPDQGVEVLGAALCLQQGNKYWHAQDQPLQGLGGWVTLTLNGTFDPATFTAYPGTAGQPSFAAGVETKFGLGTFEHNVPSGAYGLYFDNWSLENATLLPEPASLTLLATAAGLMCVRRPRRRGERAA
jgi:hypothetical protein